MPRNIASGRDALDHTEHTNLSLDLLHRNSTFLAFTSLIFSLPFKCKEEFRLKTVGLDSRDSEVKAGLVEMICAIRGKSQVDLSGH